MSKTTLFFQMLASAMTPRENGTVALNETELFMLEDAFNDAVDERVQQRERAL